MNEQKRDQTDVSVNDTPNVENNGGESSADKKEHRKVSSGRRRGGRNRRDRDHRRGEQEIKDAAETAAELAEAEETVTADPAVDVATSAAAEESALPSSNEAEAEEASSVGNADVSPEDERPESVEVVGIRFRTSGKVYYFDPLGVSYTEGGHAIVETARGTEYGDVALGNRFVKSSEIVPPLRPALRPSTAEDDAHYAANREKEKEAFDICLQRIAAHGLEMKLVDAEYTFDNSKLLFYYTADGRVDFRELVKNLASVFRCRIELRQIGIRDEAKALGGLGICGRPYCCHSFLPDFVQVSIKMAKEQSLSLNSAKISGACGRLMCCLRYEYDTYLEEGKRTPKVDSIVHTRDGDGVVVEAKPLTGMVKIRPLDDPDAAPRVYSREDVFPGKGDPSKPLPPKETKEGKEPKEIRNLSGARERVAPGGVRFGKVSPERTSAQTAAGAKEKENKELKETKEPTGGRTGEPRSNAKMPKDVQKDPRRESHGRSSSRKNENREMKEEKMTKEPRKEPQKDAAKEDGKNSPKVKTHSYQVVSGKNSTAQTQKSLPSEATPEALPGGESGGKDKVFGQGSGRKGRHRPYRRGGKPSKGGTGEGTASN